MADNIEVVVRTRPLLERELKSGGKLLWRATGETIQCTAPASKQYSYTFDAVFAPENSTRDVYKYVEPIIRSTMSGFNGTVFAYGQTSSGKTHTMMGNTSEPGIIPLAVNQIFDTIEGAWDREFLLRVSYIELYNENVVDLLSNSRAHLDVREDLDGKVFVEKLEEKICCSPEEIMDLIRRGEEKRHFGATNMNEKSSRSHTIFKVVIESKLLEDTGNSCINVSSLNLVDLAGSEKAKQTGAVGQRLAEGGFINKSLSALAKVISQLSESTGTARYVSYRDSKLTRILQNSLGGNSKTAIICNCTPSSLEETLSTLRFATSAKKITNKPVINEVLSNEAMIMRYKQQIGKLQQELDKMKLTDAGVMHEEKQELEQRLQKEEKLREDQQEQIQRLTNLICVSSHIKPSGDTPDVCKLKAKRRETWCPGRRDGIRKVTSLPPLFHAEAPSFDSPIGIMSLDVTRRSKSKDVILEEESPVKGEEVDGDLEATQKELVAAQKALRDRDEELANIKLRCGLLESDVEKYETELKELQEFTEMERELKEISFMEKVTTLSNKSSSEKDVEGLQAILEKDRQDAEIVLTQLQKELAVSQDQNKQLLLQMDELKKNVTRLENEKGDFDFCMEAEKEKFSRREHELKEQLELAYKEMAQSSEPGCQEKPGELNQEQARMIEELKNQVKSLEADLARRKSSQPQPMSLAEELEDLTVGLTGMFPQRSLLGTAPESSELEDEAANELQRDLEHANGQLREEIAKLTAHGNDLEHANGQLREEIAKLTAHGNDLEHANGPLREEIAKLTAHGNDLEHANGPLREEIAKLTAHGNDLEHANGQLREEIAKLTAHGNDLEHANGQLREEIAKLTAHGNDLEHANGPLREEIAMLTAHGNDLEHASGPLREEIAKLTAHGNDLEHANGQLREEIAKLTAHGNDLEHANGPLREEIAKLTAHGNDLEKANATLREEVTKLTINGEDLAKANDQLKQEATEAEERERKLKIQHDDKAEELLREIQELLGALTETRQSQDVLTSRNKELQAENRHLLQTVSRSDEQARNENMQLQEAVSDYALKEKELTSEKVELQALVEEFKAQNKELQCLFESGMAKEESLQVELKHVRSELQGISDSASEKERELLEKISTLSNDNDITQSQNVELVAQQQEMTRQLQEMEARNREIEETVARLRHESEVKDSKIVEALLERDIARDEIERQKARAEATQSQDEQVAALHDDVTRLSSEARQQALSLERLQTDLSKKDEELHATRAEIETLNATIARGTELYKQLKEDYEEVGEDWNELVERHEELEKEKEVLIAQNEQRDAEQISRIEELRADYEGKVEKFEEQISGLEEETRNRQEELHSVGAELEECRAQLTECRAELTEHKIRCSSHSADIEASTATANSATEELARLREESVRKEAELREQVEAYKSGGSQAWTEIRSLQEKYVTLLADYNRLKQLPDNDFDMLPPAQTFVAELAAMREEYQTRFDELLAYKEAEEGRSESEQCSYAVMMARVKEVSQNSERIASENGKLIQKVRELESRVAEIQAEAKEEEDRLKRCCDEADEELMKKSMEKAAVEQQLEKLKKSIACGNQDQTAEKEKLGVHPEDVPAAASNAPCSLSALQGSDMGQNSERLVLENKKLVQKVRELESRVAEIQAEAKEEEDRLKRCCDEADEELIQKSMEKAAVEQQLEKLRKSIACGNKDQTAKKYMPAAASDASGSLSALQGSDMGQVSERLVLENKNLVQKVRELESRVAEIQAEAKEEEDRLKRCCDEADEELMQKSMEKAAVEQQLEKLKKSIACGNKDQRAEVPGANNAPCSLSALQGSGMGKNSERLVLENKNLVQKVRELESRVAEIQAEAKEEEDRLKRCCDEADEELMQKSMEKAAVEQQLEKLKASMMRADKGQTANLKVEINRLNARMQEMQQTIAALKEQKERLEGVITDQRKELIKQEKVQQPYRSREATECHISGSGVTADIMKCRLETEKKRHESEVRYLRDELQLLKKKEASQSSIIKDLRQEVTTCKKQMHEKRKLADRHVLREIANSPIASSANRLTTPVRSAKNKNKDYGEGFNILSTPNPGFSSPVVEEEYRVCTPPDPCADVQCPQQ